jgi:hypothetical protein
VDGALGAGPPGSVRPGSSPVPVPPAAGAVTSTAAEPRAAPGTDATPTGAAEVGLVRGDAELGSLPAGVLPSGLVRGDVTVGPAPAGEVTFGLTPVGAAGAVTSGTAVAGAVMFGPGRVVEFRPLGDVTFGEVPAGVGCVPLPTGPGSEEFGVVPFGRLPAALSGRELRSIPESRLVEGVVPPLDVSVPKGDHGLRPPADRGPGLPDSPLLEEDPPTGPPLPAADAEVPAAEADEGPASEDVETPATEGPEPEVRDPADTDPPPPDEPSPPATGSPANEEGASTAGARLDRLTPPDGAGAE